MVKKKRKNTSSMRKFSTVCLYSSSSSLFFVHCFNLYLFSTAWEILDAFTDQNVIVLLLDKQCSCLSLLRGFKREEAVARKYFLFAHVLRTLVTLFPIAGHIKRKSPLKTYMYVSSSKCSSQCLHREQFESMLVACAG